MTNFCQCNEPKVKKENKYYICKCGFFIPCEICEEKIVMKKLTWDNITIYMCKICAFKYWGIE